jgi:Ankyrin repeats (3 copies)/Ankyrin repeat
MTTLQRKQELLDVVQKGNIDLLESLLKEGGGVNSIYPNGQTLLIAAIERQNQPMVEFLIQAGADVNKRDFYDRTPLMYAVDRKDDSKAEVAIVQSLLDSGAEADAKNKQGRTALMYAAYRGAAHMTDILLSAGAAVNLRDPRGESAWDFANYKWEAAACRQILEIWGAETTSPQTTKERTGFLQRIREMIGEAIELDEFTEFVGMTPWNLPSSCLFYGFLFMISLMAGGPGFIRLLFFGVGCIGLMMSPSTWKILPLWRELRQMRLGRPLPPISSRRKPAREDIQSRNDMEFVSRLMELASPELSTINLTHPNGQTLERKQALFASRIRSTLLTASVFIFPFFLPARSYDGILLAVLPLWTWPKSRLEYRLRGQRLRLVQEDRDRSAGEISQLLNAEEYANKALPPEFGLYLRAFMTTDKLHLQGIDLETIVAYSIAPSLPLLALGKPGEHIGAGRIRTSDEGWQEEILRLMEAARLILIIPSHRTGTLWEIDTLRTLGYFKKTIFIMPPELTFHDGKYSQDWKKTVTAAQAVGVEFPNHIAEGVFFRLGENGDFEDFAPLVSKELLKEQAPVGGGGGDAGSMSIEAGTHMGPNHTFTGGLDGSGGLGSVGDHAGGHDGGGSHGGHGGDGGGGGAAGGGGGHGGGHGGHGD